MNPDDPSRRQAAEALAAYLATPEGLREARHLQAEGRLHEILAPVGAAPRGRPDAPPTATGPRPPRRPEPISIWAPQDDPEFPGGTIFVRPEPHPLGDHHASRPVLRPKRDLLPLRVALFGESAAAGYLYAPHWTPALALEAQLRAAGGLDNFEVIDLARTNERLGSLAQTVRAALQIQPDVLVLYAGNNWNLLETPEVSPYAASVPARLAYAAALRDAALDGAIHLAEAKVREIADTHLDLIALIASAVQIPVVLVIPEVNLGDWETRQPPTWLPGDGLPRWYDDHAAALDHLAGARWGPARTTAERMIARDTGRCSTSWRLLARALEGLGDLEGAAEAAHREIDAAPYATLGFLSAPQANALTRRILLDKAAEHGWLKVDLRETFERASASPLPGRDLFLDYCHLGSKGIEIAMAAVARQVIEVSGLIEEPLPEIGALPPLPPAVEATARLGAALHTAHRHLPVGPKGPLLELWLEGAIAADPGITAALRDLLEIRTSPLPAILTAAQRRNFDSPYRLLLQHGLRWEQLDADLLLAIVAVLERHGTPVRAEMDERLIAHFLPNERGIELTEPPFLWEPLERFFPDVMEVDDLPPRGTFRPPWPESSFCLIGDGRSEIEIEANLRLPNVPWQDERREGTVDVRLNGERVASFVAGGTWTRSAIRIAGSSVRRGLNRLTLRWPIPAGPDEADPEAPLRAAIGRLEIGVAADLHPVFGDVYSLVARLG